MLDSTEMSSFAAAADAYRPAHAVRSAWIESPSFDLLFFVFAPLLTVPILLGVYLHIPWLANGGGIALSFVHYVSSYTFYFWNENKAYYRSRWIAFLVGPVVLAAIVFGLLIFHVPYFLQLTLFFWNTFHVARQNCGILSIYRHRAGVVDPTERNRANLAILSVSGFLALWNIDTHTEVARVLGAVSRYMSSTLLIAAGAIAVFAIVRLGIGLTKRFSRQAPLGLAEGLFLAGSLLFFWPYLVVRDSNVATFVMLQPHYIQYLALVWLLHRRKFGSVAKNGAPAWLRGLSGSLGLLVGTLLLMGFSFYAFYRLSYHFHQAVYFDRIYLLIAFEHFYIDGLVWSFKQRHIRNTVAPYLLNKPATAAA
jgi:hypothetical protein